MKETEKKISVKTKQRCENQESQDTRPVSRRGFHGSVSMLVCLVIHVSSQSHHYVMTVSLLVIAKCLFCIETLAFILLLKVVKSLGLFIILAV